MATDSSILAQRMPWTEEPGGLLGLHRVGDKRATHRSTAVTNALLKTHWTTVLVISFLVWGLNAGSELTYE